MCKTKIGLVEWFLRSLAYQFEKHCFEKNAFKVFGLPRLQTLIKRSNVSSCNLGNIFNDRYAIVKKKLAKFDPYTTGALLLTSSNRKFR